jgi:hypothetical protein
MEKRRNTYNVLVGKAEGKIPLGRRRHGWEDDIKTDLQETGVGGNVEWIHMAQERDKRWLL